MKMSRKSSKHKINLSNILNNEQLRDINNRRIWGEDPELNQVSDQTYGFFWSLKNRESGQRTSFNFGSGRRESRASSKEKKIMEQLVMQKSTVQDNIDRINQNLNQLSMKQNPSGHKLGSSGNWLE